MCAIASSIGVIFRSGNSSTGNLTAWGRVGSIIPPQELVVQGEFGAQVTEGPVGQGVAGLDHEGVHLGRFGGPAEGGEQFDGELIVGLGGDLGLGEFDGGVLGCGPLEFVVIQHGLGEAGDLEGGAVGGDGVAVFVEGAAEEDVVRDGGGPGLVELPHAFVHAVGADVAVGVAAEVGDAAGPALSVGEAGGAGGDFVEL